MNEEFNIGNAARQYGVKNDINTAEESGFNQPDYDDPEFDLVKYWIDYVNYQLDSYTIDFLKEFSVEYQNAKKLAKQVRSCRFLNIFCVLLHHFYFLTPNYNFV